MGALHVYHCRDHLNGGFFEEEEYLTTGARFGAIADIQAPTMIRFRFDPWPTGFSEYHLWGQGQGSTDEYSLKLEKVGDNAQARVNIFNQVYDFKDFVLYPGMIYEIDVYSTSAGATLHLYVRDQWGKILYFASTARTAETGAFSTGTTLFIGATQKADLTRYGVFYGTIFDAHYHDFTTANDQIKLTFIQGYNGAADDNVADFFGIKNAVIIGAGSEFWPAQTEISDYVTAVDTIRYDRDELDVQTLSEWGFDYVSSAIEIKPGDMILLGEDTNIHTWFEVTETSDKQDITTVNCRAPLSGLFDCEPETCIEINPAPDGGVEADSSLHPGWWSNLRPKHVTGTYKYTDTEHWNDATYGQHRWYSVLYLLQYAIAVLQLDHIFSVTERRGGGTTNLFGVNSQFHYESWSTTTIQYNQFAINYSSLIRAGRSNSADSDGAATMGDIWLEILKMLRLRCYTTQQTVEYAPKAALTPLTIADTVTYEIATELLTRREHYLITQARQDPIQGIWASSYTDAAEIEVLNRIDTLVPIDALVDIPLVTNLLIGMHGTANQEWNTIDHAAVNTAMARDAVSMQSVALFDSLMRGSWSVVTKTTNFSLLRDPGVNGQSSNWDKRTTAYLVEE